MIKYCEDFAQYAKRRIYECPCIESADGTKWSDVYVKLDTRLEANSLLNNYENFATKSVNF